jgi:hypothetical protein
MGMHENCADCVEYYHTCRTWPENRPFACADFYRLPDVLPGTTGQRVPSSRMGGRTEPRVRRESTAEDDQEPAHASTPAPARKRPKPKDSNRIPSPAATPGQEGERLCTCGATLPKRRRCCDNCRQTRREETASRHNVQKRQFRASHAVSDTRATHATVRVDGPASPGHN